MARVKRGLNAKKRHKKVLRQAKGYYGSKHTLYRTANQAVMKSLNYAYIGRKHRKRDFRKLWIARINAAARANGTSYSQFMGNLKKANIDINRKLLAEIAVENPAEFTKLVELANQNA